MSVISLVPPTTVDSKYRDNAIEHLELALSRVRAGEVVSVGIVEVTRDGGSYTHWSHVDNVNTMLGACLSLILQIGGMLRKDGQ